jgi:hypothetical protein
LLLLPCWLRRATAGLFVCLLYLDTLYSIFPLPDAVAQKMLLQVSVFRSLCMKTPATMKKTKLAGMGEGGKETAPPAW